MSNKWLVKRTIQMVVTFIGAITLAFGIVRLMPGGPIDYLRAQIMTSQGSSNINNVHDQVEIYTNINPSDPLHIQYLEYMSSIIVNQDLGMSIWYERPVMDILVEALPWTIFLSIVSLAVSFSIAIILGAALAYFEGSRFDFVGSSISILITSVPFYVIALLLIMTFGYFLEWFPTSGRVNSDIPAGLTLEYMGSIIYYAVLPILALIAAGFGGTALSMRGNSIRILGEDYLRVARLRGLPEKLIVTRYIGRNAFLPLYTGLMISMATIVGGSIILETIFTYPGMGWYMNRAFQARDYPLLMGSFLLTTILIVIGIYIADLTYDKIDPRVERGDSRESF